MKYSVLLLASALSLGAQPVRMSYPTIVIPPQPDGLGKPSGIFPTKMLAAYGFNQLANQEQG